MKITEMEGSQFSSSLTPIGNKEPDRQKIKDDIADFRSIGGVIESIPTGLSGSMYSARPLTAKQSREKLKLAIKHQQVQTISG